MQGAVARQLTAWYRAEMADPKARSFGGRVESTASGGVTILLDFDPAAAWGRRDRYHVTGTIDGVKLRGPLAKRQGAWQIALEPKSKHEFRLQDGQSVAVWPEGPHHEELAPDIAGALAARPQARAAFTRTST
jgi:hypothetical protein